MMHLNRQLRGMFMTYYEPKSSFFGGSCLFTGCYCLSNACMCFYCLLLIFCWIFGLISEPKEKDADNHQNKTQITKRSPITPKIKTQIPPPPTKKKKDTDYYFSAFRY